jgi:hypothetical protein
MIVAAAVTTVKPTVKDSSNIIGGHGSAAVGVNVGSIVVPDPAVLS